MPIICNNCGQNVPDDSLFCPKCGTKVTAARCTGCGAVLTADAKFCSNCGTPAGNDPVPIEPNPSVELEQRPQAAKVQEVCAELEPDPDKAVQRLSGQTPLADTLRQSPRHFDWKYWGVSILRGYGTTRNSVEITDESVVFTSKLNKRAIYDATTVPVKNIASVEVWEKVSVLSALMVAALVGGFGGLMALIPFGVTAIDPSSAEGIGSMLGLVILLAVVIFAALFRIHHWRITIKTHKEPQYIIYELSAKPKERELLFQLQDAILVHTGTQGEPVRRKSNKLVPTIITSIVVALAIIAAMLLSHPEIFETKQADDSSDKNLIPFAEVENKPDIQPQGEVSVAPPEPDHWIYNPYNILSADTGALLNVQNFLWDQNYQSVVALAVIRDSLEQESLANYVAGLKEDWGLREDDMICLIYNNGESCHWLPNQAFFDYFNFDNYNGLQEILNVGYQADLDGDYESALKNFYAYLDDCYAMVYGSISGNDTNQGDILPIDESIELIYSSGVGAWQTNLILYSDGSFEGSYYDTDMGDSDERYPNGTVYICSFIGHFSDITQMNDYTYSLTLESGDMFITTGGAKWIENGVRNIPEEWVEDGIRYVPTGPIGLIQGINFLLYTPEAPIDELSAEFLDWWPGRFEEDPLDTLSCYGLYNEDGGSGFFSYE